MYLRTAAKRALRYQFHPRSSRLLSSAANAVKRSTYQVPFSVSQMGCGSSTDNKKKAVDSADAPTKMTLSWEALEKQDVSCLWY